MAETLEAMHEKRRPVEAESLKRRKAWKDVDSKTKAGKSEDWKRLRPDKVETKKAQIWKSQASVNSKCLISQYNPSWFLDMSGPRPNCQQQSGIQNLIRVYDLLLIAKDYSFATSPPPLVYLASAAELMLISESQALLRPASRLSHHVTMTPLVAFINSVR